MKEQASVKRINLAVQAEAVQRALHQALQQALSIHKRLGNPIATWKDGKVVLLQPEEIVLSSELSEHEK